MKNISGEKFPFLNINLLQSRNSWSINLRWLAVSGYFLSTLVAKYLLHLPLPYESIWFVLGLLAIINVLYLMIFKLFKEFSIQAEINFLQIHIIVDLLFLTVLIHLSGGVENPIYLFYVFHVVLSSIIFPGWRPIFIATLVVFLFSVLIYLEYSGILFHYSIFKSNLHSSEVFIYLVLAVFIITIYVNMYICMTVMFIYRDIKRQIDSKNQQLINADKQKTQFYRFTSHELKSPVVAIKSSVDSVLKNFASEMDNRAKDLLFRASLRASQMLEIIRELLELSRNRSRMAELGSELVDINSLILEIIEQQKVQADEKSIRINTKLSKEPPLINGHQADFKEVILNLVTNAIRYSRENDSVTITTKIVGEEIELTVDDTGIGIAQKDLPKIFDEFYRSENAKKEVKIGTGLGLSIVKQIVDNYNGTINVQSTLGEGTRFILRFPK
jgi:signal transduction histidine kinase